MTKPSILHVCGRETVLELRDEILRYHGFDVTSTLEMNKAMPLFLEKEFDLVLIDVEGEGRVVQAEHLCGVVKDAKQDQKVAFLCNHRVSIESDCPDEVIRAEFEPRAMVRGVQEILQAP
jgi:DNA-binding response OmpR family regulator